jgi:hypothetical protein
MKNAINARATEAEKMMMMVMAGCNMGIVVILKENFVPNCRRDGEMGRRGKGGEGDESWSSLWEEGSAGIIILVGRAIFQTL